MAPKPRRYTGLLAQPICLQPTLSNSEFSGAFAAQLLHRVMLLPDHFGFDNTSWWPRPVAQALALRHEPATVKAAGDLALLPLFARAGVDPSTAAADLFLVIDLAVRHVPGCRLAPRERHRLSLAELCQVTIALQLGHAYYADKGVRLSDRRLVRLLASPNELRLFLPTKVAKRVAKIVTMRGQPRYGQARPMSPRHLRDIACAVRTGWSDSPGEERSASVQHLQRRMRHDVFPIIHRLFAEQIDWATTDAFKPG